MNVVGNVLLTSGSSAEQQVHIRATTVSTDTTQRCGGGSALVNMGNNLSVVGDINRRFNFLIRMPSEIRWNSKQQFYIQDYFAADNRFDFVTGNGQKNFMSNTHTPSNILFSRAFSDTSYNDLKYIIYW
jgi:hypothetical protein